MIFQGGYRRYIGSNSCWLTNTDIYIDSLGKKAVIHAELALGEGTGAVMMFPLLDMALQVYRENTTFDDIQIAAYEDYGKC